MGFIPQLDDFSFPDGEDVRDDHVKREIPGIRGSTRNQMTKTAAYTRIALIPTSYT